MTNLILETLGLTYLNPLEAEVALRRITNDSFALKRAQEICLSQFLPAAIQSLLPIEKAALVKRCNVAPPFTQPVTWHINDSHDQNGDYFGLTANCWYTESPAEPMPSGFITSLAKSSALIPTFGIWPSLAR